MRRLPIVVCLLGLLLPACSSTETSTTVTSAAVAGSTVPPTTGVAPAVEPPSDAGNGALVPPVTVSVGASAVPTAPLVPVVVCMRPDVIIRPAAATATTAVIVAEAGASTTATVPPFTLSEDSQVVFGYTNEAVQAVVVPSGDRNELRDAAPDDDPLVPVAFAPGRVDLAFVANVGPGGTVPTWRLTGPDGVTRSAAPTAATPDCDRAQLGLAPSADGPTLAYGYRTVRGADGRPASVELRVDVVGLPALSACPNGLVRRAPVTRLRVDGQERAPGESTTVARTDTLRFVRVEAYVADVCEADGTPSAGWAVGEVYDTLRQGTSVCLRFEDAGVVLGQLGQAPGCDPLPLTGGIKSRRVTIAP